VIPRYTKFPRPNRVFLGWTWEKYIGHDRADPVDLYYNTEHNVVSTTNKKYGGAAYDPAHAAKIFPRYADQIRAIATLCSN